PQALLGIQRKFVLLDTNMAVALDTLHDLSEGGVLVFERSHEKTRLVLFDPSSHTIEDLGLAQVLAGDPECLACQVSGVAGNLMRKRPVFIGDNARFAGRYRSSAPKQFSGLLDSAPTQVIDQLARNPLQESGVRFAKKLKDDTPLAFSRYCIRGRPALERGS